MIIYNDGTSDFKYKRARNNESLPDSLGKYPKMLTELYKPYGVSFPVMKEVFTKRELNCSLRNSREIMFHNPPTVKFGTDNCSPHNHSDLE